MTTQLWIIVAVGVLLYGLLIVVALYFGPRWFSARFSEREQYLARLVTKSEETYDDLQGQIKAYRELYQAKDGELARMQRSSIERDRKIEELTEEVRSLRTKLEAETAAVAALKRQLEETNVIKKEPPLPLLVAVGSDAELKIDLASLRAVRTDTGMEFTRIEDASLEKLKRYLDRARINGRPFRRLHLAVHAGPEGIMLGGKLVNSVQLSEILEGIEVLLLAGCEGDAVGDFLGIVPYVVTMTIKVGHVDAALFTRAFWEEIGLGKEPSDALDLALDRAPSGMSEYVERHF